jgi:predicted transcriptional regulator
MARHKPNRRAIPITITLPDDLLAAVDNLADAQQLSRSQLIARMVRQGIESEKVALALFSNTSATQTMAKLFSDPATLRTIGAAMGEKVEDSDLEKFNRAMRLAVDSAGELAEGKKKGKGKKS